MSLESLAQLRRAHGKPTGVLKVVIGRRVPAVEGDADVICVAPGSEPLLMDWRAVVGLPMALFVCEGHDLLAERTLDAVVAAGAKLIGAAWRDVTTSTDEAIKPVLHRIWEVLCLR